MSIHRDSGSELRDREDGYKPVTWIALGPTRKSGSGETQRISRILVVSVSIWTRVIHPSFPMSVLRTTLRLFLRPRVEGDFPDKEGVLLTADHVSYWDGPMLAVWFDREVIFVVHPDFARNWFWARWIRFWCGLWRHKYLPLSRSSPFGLRHLLEAPSETVICLFPEGAIRRQADPLPWQAGTQYLLERRPDLEHWHLTACPGWTRPSRSGAKPCWRWKIEPAARLASLARS